MKWSKPCSSSSAHGCLARTALLPWRRRPRASLPCVKLGVLAASPHFGHSPPPDLSQSGIWNDTVNAWLMYFQWCFSINYVKIKNESMNVLVTLQEQKQYMQTERRHPSPRGLLPPFVPPSAVPGSGKSWRRGWTRTRQASVSINRKRGWWRIQSTELAWIIMSQRNNEVIMPINILNYDMIKMN